MEAARAWLQVFVGGFEPLRGADGGEWLGRDELTFELFVLTLYSVQGGKSTRGSKRQRRRPRWHLEERRRPRPLPPIEQDVVPFPVLIPPSALAVVDGGGAAVGAALEGGGEPPA